jgi:hypothetical protein
MDLETMRTPGDPTLTRIFVPAMDCPDEEKEIRSALSKLPSVESMTFHLFSRQVEVRHRSLGMNALMTISSFGPRRRRRSVRCGISAWRTSSSSRGIRRRLPGKPERRLASNSWSTAGRHGNHAAGHFQRVAPVARPYVTSS